ncbi:uncharacterized protein MYCFIDRAFT_47386 [Pseudocercospora fijiensis CIRAD86]|uniref:Glucose-methanol-choline oxidoreductase N-terminal domain-containing protein n=1 Tax=Pseudocercospora fijiensis (strain CIRAD86) TaxID=383855 RepID=M2YM20_PSEFD|nr:uncharacterized protein MYCFIDRAFT_47386 [Pseudocercospora fijiensis CIRAD86]EME78760.1 hypothetical protein MYCFIDRAFT_47386 [Pseudocercospora fijiensis CIRAD86]
MTQDDTNLDAFKSQHYDYLIIGGGTAGLVMAARLSENRTFNIGVLEAGYDIPENTPAVSVPGNFGDGIGTEYDWKFSTAPQKQLNNRKLPWPRGKALGGSSALNFMTWNRPSRDDLDAWERLGCEGWGWEGMLPFYKKSEHFIEPSPQTKARYKQYFDAKVHGKNGPVKISFCKEYSEAHELWHETMNNLGVETNEKPMSGSNIGAWTSCSAVDPETVTREYAASAYLKPARERENLSVLGGASVRKIVIESVEGEWVAKGVEFEYSGSYHTVLASREVILSAGSVNSPQILELSGIGNAAILQNAGIECKVQNVNVGENLQDHLMTATIYEIDPSTLSPDDLRNDPEKATAAGHEYKTKRSGLRTRLTGSFAYIPLSTLVPSDKNILASLVSLATKPHSQTLAHRLTNPSSKHGYIEYIFDVGNWNPLTPVSPGKKYATLLQILQYAFSRGNIHINPAAPSEHPVIDPQYFENEGHIDLEILMRGAEFGEKILETEPLKRFVRGRVFPPKNVTTEEWKEWVLGNVTTDWHPVGTCAMGKDVGSGGVVDSRLRVFGVRGLRVVDASVMPLQISAHLQATVYAIGEKAARMVLEDAGA